MITNFVQKDHEILIESEKGASHVQFGSKVKTVLKYKGSLIVRVADGEEYKDRNIFRVSEEGKIIWQIEQPEQFRGIDADRSTCFTYLGLDKEGKIIAHSLNDFTYEIDFETGKFLSKVHEK